MFKQFLILATVALGFFSPRVWAQSSDELTLDNCAEQAVVMAYNAHRQEAARLKNGDAANLVPYEELKINIARRLLKEGVTFRKMKRTALYWVRDSEETPDEVYFQHVMRLALHWWKRGTPVSPQLKICSETPFQTLLERNQRAAARKQRADFVSPAGRESGAGAEVKAAI